MPGGSYALSRSSFVYQGRMTDFLQLDYGMMTGALSACV